MSRVWSRFRLAIDGWIGRLFHDLANEPWRSEHPELREERWPKPRQAESRSSGSQTRSPPTAGEGDQRHERSA